MFKRIALFLAGSLSLLCLQGAENRSFALGGMNFRTFSADVKPSEAGAFEVTIQACPDNWPILHIAPEKSGKINKVSLTVQQLSPKGKVGRRVFIGCQPKEIARTVQLRDLLQDGKPHTLTFDFKPGQKFSDIEIGADHPAEAIVLKVSDLSFSAEEFQPRPALPPLPAVTFRGKPFFPLGCYDCNDLPRTLFGMDPGFLASGGNITMLGQLGLPGHVYYQDFRQPVLYKRLEYAMSRPEYKDVAFIVGIDPALATDSSEAEKQGIGGYHKPLTPEQVAEHSKVLIEDLRRLRACPNVIGYTVDEPENLMWPYFKRNISDKLGGDRDAQLAKLVMDSFGWAWKLIRQEHPEAKLMPIIAWWTSYDAMADFYDVNMPNEYPNGKAGSKEFEVDLFTVNYDAAMAVAAARRAGGSHTVIYMPGMWNQRGKQYRDPTLREQRYCCFAPITRGAMGIFGWRLLRCEADYRDNVVYPVMSEISELKDYFLGEWHDELVSSDRDTTTAEYLKKFKERSRMVEGEADGELKAADNVVPDVSYCLRRNPADGSYLLLAVNNMREPVKVTFQIALEGLPADAVDKIDRHRIRIKNGQFTDAFEPFDVHAYVFSLQE